MLMSISYDVDSSLEQSRIVRLGWVQFGEVLHIADKAIISGDATSMIIVMP